MKAILLCAGLGTRLGQSTRTTPKALLPVNGQPLVAYSLSWLADQRITEVRINLHHRPDAISEVVGDGRSFGLTVEYAYEPTLLGTAGTVRSARSWVGQDDVLVVYGDLLIDEDLDPMWRQHRKLGSDATLLVHRRAGSNSVVSMDADRRITSFVERPELAARAADAWVNSGVQILSPALIAQIRDHVPADLPKDVYSRLVRTATFHGYPLTARRIAIDSPERLAQADELARLMAAPTLRGAP